MGRSWGLAIALVLAMSASAYGETATIGSTLATPGSANLPSCASGFECIAFTTNNGTPVAIVPFDGVVTSWRVYAGSNASPVTLRVLRPGASGSYTAVSSSGAQSTTGGAYPDVYPSNIPVEQGDVVALANSTSALLYATAPAGFSVNYFQSMVNNQPALPDGSSGTPNGSPYAAHEVAMNATVMRAEADLSLKLSGSPDPVGKGQDLTYLVTIANAGPQAAKGVSVTDSLPASVTPKSATPSTGTCTLAATVTCALGTIASGASQTVAIVVTPGTAGSIANAASVTSATSDPDATNNSATVTTTVNEEPVTTPTAPTLSSFTFAPARFRLGSFLPKAITAAAKKAPVGTTISYVVTDATKVVLRFARLRKGKSPIAAGTLTRAVVTGINRVGFSGRLSKTRRLRPARYRVTAVSKGPGGTSAPLRRTITVLKH